MASTIYFILLILSSVITAALGIYAIIKKREAKYTIAFFLNAIMLSIWSLANLMELSATFLPVKLLWANIQYIAYCFIPWTLLYFSLKVTGYDEWFIKKKLYRYMIISFLSLIFVLTDQFHGLFRTNLSIAYNGYFTYIKKDFSPYIFFQLIVNYTISMGSLVVLLIFIIKQKGYMRKRATILLISQCLISVPNILYSLNISILPKVDSTPIFFGLIAGINAWSIYRYKLLSIDDVARFEIIKDMDIAYAIINENNELIDMNTNFKKVFNAYGNDFKQSFSNILDEKNQINNLLYDNRKRVEINVNQSIFELRKIGVKTNNDHETYQLIIAYDITKRKEHEALIVEQEKALAVAEEKQMIARDIHDHLGQLMAFVAMQSEGIKQEMINNEIDFDITKIEKIIYASQNAHMEVRRLIKVIGGQGIDKFSFFQELSKEIELFKIRTTTIPTLKIEGDIYSLPKEIEFNLKCIIKEALTNVIKHSKAKHVQIYISRMNHIIKLKIKDDGVGMDVEKSINEEHYGLSFIKNRIKEINGKVDFFTKGGFTIQVEIEEQINE